MPVTVSQIREMASHSTVEVALTDGRTFMIRDPDHVGGSPSGRQITLPSGADVLVLVEAGDIADVRGVVPDPDVEKLRAGEVPPWMMDRMRGYPDSFVRAARMEPGDLARVLGRTER